MARAYLMQVAIAVDQLGNAVAGGWADETWSSRCWRERRRCWIALLDLIFGVGHCRKAYDSERERLQLPPELRPCLRT